MISIIVRSFGCVHYFTAETRAAAELLRAALACSHTTVEVWRGDTLLV
jgi:hypothetical protein